MMDTDFDVLVVGELNVDLIFNGIGQFPVIGKEVLADIMDLTLGSSSAIFASNLSTIGVKVAFTGMIGNDVFGDLVIRSLEKKNVDTRYILRSEELNTGATVVMNHDNDRAMLTYQGAMAALRTPDILPSMLFSAGHLHVSSIFLQPGIKEGIIELMKMARDSGMTTSLDPQWDPEEKWDLPWDTLLRYVDIFLPNMQEFLHLTGKRNLQEAVNKFQDHNGIIAIKDGTNGAYCYSGGRLMHQPAYLNNNVVDCIGAGDSFDAGFISRFIQGHPTAECLQFGNLMGALNTTAVGGTGAFTSLQAIHDKSEELFHIKIS